MQAVPGTTGTLPGLTPDLEFTTLCILGSLYSLTHQLMPSTQYGPYWTGLGYTDGPTSPPNLMFLYLGGSERRSYRLWAGVTLCLRALARNSVVSTRRYHSQTLDQDALVRSVCLSPFLVPSSSLSSKSHDFANPPHAICPSLQVLT